MIEPNALDEIGGGRGPEPCPDEQDWPRTEQKQQNWLRLEQDEQDYLRAKHEILAHQQR
jgi:hypothetical protein